MTAAGRRPRVERLPAAAGSGNPLLGEGECVFRRDGSLSSHPTRYYERSLLPVGERLAGPAVVFQRDTTTVVPPGWTLRAEASGSLILDR